MPKSEIIIETNFPQDLDDAIKMLATLPRTQEDISLGLYKDIGQSPKALSGQGSFIAKIESEIVDKFLRCFND